MTIRTSFFYMLVLFCFALVPKQASSNELGEIFNKVQPAVVGIKTLSIQNLDLTAQQDKYTDRTEYGAGVLVSADGKIMTSAHIVQTADKIIVEFLDGQQIRAKVISSAPWADVAILELEENPKVNKPAILADSDGAQVGDKVFAVGAPFGMSHTLSVGYIGSRDMSAGLAGSTTKVEVFQTDIATNSGNAGGPLFNMEGEVIGIMSSIKSQAVGLDGIGYVITSKTAKKIMADEGFWSGIEGIILTGKLAEIFNVPQSAGLLVQKISENSPAAQMGLKPSLTPIVIGDQKMLIGGDIVLGVSDIQIDNIPNLYDILKSYFSQLRRGDIYEVKVLRGGEIVTLTGRKE